MAWERIVRFVVEVVAATADGLCLDYVAVANWEADVEKGRSDSIQQSQDWGTSENKYTRVDGATNALDV